MGRWADKKRARRGLGAAPKSAPEPEKKPEPDYRFDKRTELFECTYCNKALKTEQGIRDHVAGRHQE